ncbi:hypothetical protein T439DRAFT_374032 [Meredithblackwellia eburnea MCA 4105]
MGATYELVVNLLEQLGEKELLPERTVKLMDEVVAAVLRHPRIRYEIKSEEVVSNIINCLADSSTTEVRAAAYRVLRHLVVDQHDVYELQVRFLDLFLIRTLSRDHKFEVEKEQALRLVRHLLSLPDIAIESAPVPHSVIRAVVALAESADEKLRLASLQTLGELLLRDIPLLVSGEGLRVVLQALSDGPHDFSPFLAMGFLWVADRPETRQYLRPGLDVEIVLAGFTETQSKGSSQEERVRAGVKIISLFLQSWSGLLYLNANGRQALLSLVSSLTSPSAIVREALLDMFFDLFKSGSSQRTASPSLSNPSILNKAHPAGNENAKKGPNKEVGQPRRPNLIDQYHAMLLLVFVDAGFLEVLASVASDPKDSRTAKRVSALIAQVLQLGNRVLPPNHASRVQALPKLFSLTSSFDTSDARLAASATLSAVDSFNRNQGRTQSEVTLETHRPRANSLEERGQRQLESTKIKMGMQIDDATFRNQLLETQVLSTKDHTRWSLEILMELLEGPLLHAKRLDEAMRATKFMRRLLSLFHPLSYRFAEIPKNEATQKLIDLACTTINCLLANPDGVRFLSEDKLLPQIADCLFQLDPLSGHHTSAADIVFSKERMEKTLTSGYFDMLGTMTKSREGVKLLEQFKIFTCFYKIGDLRSRDDLIKVIIRNVDYAIDGHPRVVLSKALTSSYKHTRVFATERLGQLTRESLGSEEWQIRLLLTQLYDPSQEVCELAVRTLEEACQKLETLELVVQMRPSLDHLGTFGDILLTRFLSTAIGVHYLHEIGFIERGLEEWFHERNASYVVQIELLLASAFHVCQPTADLFHTPFDGSAPPHFYGELVKTPEGCALLDESGHFPEFAEFIRQFGLEDYDSATIAKLKSALWVVGHVGSSEGGLPFLEDEYIIESIVEIAEDSPVYSLRGTAYFALGLIASTLEGVEILQDLGWESVVGPIGGAAGICVPADVPRFVYTPPWEPPNFDRPSSHHLPAPTHHLERDALVAFANLSNHILATKASKALAKLKSRHRELFSSPTLYYRVLEMLSSYHYRLAVRRYVLDLFDISLDDQAARDISAAGEQLMAKLAQEEADGKRPNGVANGRWANGQGGGEVGDAETGAGGKVGESKWPLPKEADALLDGIEGDFTDDDESSVDEGAVTVPAQVRQPLMTIRGFLIS